MTPTSKIIRYLAGGLLIGGFWYLNRGRPVWEEALRTVAVFAVVMVMLKARLKRKSVDVQLVPLVGTKAFLVVIAAFVEESLRNSHAVGDPALAVALGLGVVVTLLGPLVDRYFFTRQASPSTAGPRPRTLR